jgi:hypothetical protein
LDINHFYQIREGTAAPTLVELKSFKWPTGPAVHHHHAASPPVTTP